MLELAAIGAGARLPRLTSWPSCGVARGRAAVGVASRQA